MAETASDQLNQARLIEQRDHTHHWCIAVKTIMLFRDWYPHMKFHSNASGMSTAGSVMHDTVKCIPMTHGIGMVSNWRPALSIVCD